MFSSAPTTGSFTPVLFAVHLRHSLWPACRTSMEGVCLTACKRQTSGRAALLLSCRAAGAGMEAAEVSSLLREALASRPEEPSGQAYQDGAAFLQSLGFRNRLEVARILDIAMNENSFLTDLVSQRRTINRHAREVSREELEAVKDYLLAQGMTEDDLRKVILEHPPVLCYDPATRLQPFFAFLADIGVKSPASTVVRRPSLLGLEVEDGLRRIVDYLKEEAGNSIEEVEELLSTTI